MNNKFSDDILQMEKELYFKQNKGVLGLVGFINDYVEKVLKEENKQEFEKQDFNLMEGYVENLIEYQNITEKVIGKKISIEIVEKFVLGQSLEEFEEFLNKDEEIIDLIIYGKEENLNKVWELFEIKTKKDLIKLYKNKEIVNLIKLLKENNFNKVFKLKGFNKEMLIDLADDEEIVYLIKKGKEENLNKVWELFEIKTKEDLIKLVKNEKYIHFFKSMIENDIETIEELINTKSNNKNTFKLNIGFNNKYVDNCEFNEKYNLEILKNPIYKKLKVLIIGKEIVGYIKPKGEESFLAFRDVFDKKGNLIFKKGWIYAISINKNGIDELIDYSNLYKENSEFDISKIVGLKINPMRKIKKENNQELYNNFDELVENFIEGYINYKNK